MIPISVLISCFICNIVSLLKISSGIMELFFRIDYFLKKGKTQGRSSLWDKRRFPFSGVKAKTPINVTTWMHRSIKFPLNSYDFGFCSFLNRSKSVGLRLNAGDSRDGGHLWNEIFFWSKLFLFPFENYREVKWYHCFEENQFSYSPCSKRFGRQWNDNLNQRKHGKCNHMRMVCTKRMYLIV